MSDFPHLRALILFAVKLVQPGMLNDVTDGLVRLLPKDGAPTEVKLFVRQVLDSLREEGLVKIYASRRYVLTSAGESVVDDSGIRHKIEARRLFLLKETRKDMLRMRSDTRDRLLQQ